MADTNGWVFGPSEKRISPEDCIDYAIKTIQDEYRNVRISPVAKEIIVSYYKSYCKTFSACYVKGYLDSFEMAACLMNAVLKTKPLFYGDMQNLDKVHLIVSSKWAKENEYRPNDFLKADLALNAAFKMCENPIFYKGEDGTKEIDMPKFDIAKFKEQYPEEWDDIKQRLSVTCLYGKANRDTTLQAYLMFKFLYHYVVEKLKQNDELKKESDQSFEQFTDDEKGISYTKKPKNSKD